MKEYIKTIINGLKIYIKNSRGDWNQNDETAPNYIKNRTHWVEKNPEIILFEEYGVPRELSNEHNPPYILSTPFFIPEVGQEYVIKINNDKIFYSTAYQKGNRIVLPLTDNGFNFGEIIGQYVYYRGEYSERTIDIIVTTPKEKVYKIDEKFLPKQNILNGESPGSVRTITTNTNIGIAAFAEGYKTTASGNNSHAEGYETTASGNSSHAEGEFTVASANGSHAEGWGTEASNDGSHAEGQWSTASGDSSHAEGYNTTASGEYSHAEGVETEASGNYSHAEGGGTIASGNNSHAEGAVTTASGKYSHAEGDNTTASGFASHAEGQETIASGWVSHAEGYSTEATQSNAHAEGQQTKANGNFSHAEGFATRANGESSHAEGNHTISSGSYSHAEGLYTRANGVFSHAEGNRTISSGNCSHAEGLGISTTYYPTYSGDANSKIYTASAWDGHCEIGEIVCYNNTYAKIIDVDTSALTITLDKTLSNEALDNVNIEIVNGIAYGESSHAEGSRTISSGECSHAEGYSTKANRDFSHAEGYITTASGRASHTEGWQTTASGESSHAEGDHTTASGKYSHAEGQSTHATGESSHAEGCATKANGRASHAEGGYTTASSEYQHVQGKFNIEDSTNTYVHIVGNGPHNAKLSNAHTLDWKGNAWFQGNIKVGGTGQDDATAKSVLTSDYITAGTTDLEAGVSALPAGHIYLVLEQE